QLIELGLILVEKTLGLAGEAARQLGRANGFMRFLRILRLGLIPTWHRRNVFATLIALDHAADRADRLFGYLDAIGSHIGDQTDGLAVDIDPFVEPLRDAHRMRWRKAELAACFLLQ